MFMGRLHPAKRLELTLECLAQLRTERPDARLLVFGRGDEAYERSLHDRAQSLGVSDGVCWAGWIEREARWEALASADVLLLNSLFENFGCVIPEAALVGTGVVASDNLSMGDDLRRSNVGEVCTPDAESLARGVLRVLDDHDSERMRRWAEEMFSPQAIASQLGSMYASVMDGDRRGTQESTT